MKKKIPAVDPRAALVDELGDLQAQAAPLNARIKELKGLLTLEFVGKAPETAFHVFGARFEMTLSACKKVRSITDMLRLFKILGVRKFLENCSFPLAAVDEHLTLPERAAVLTESRGSTREMTVTPVKAPQAVAA